MRIRSLCVAVLCVNVAFCASSQQKVQRQREKDPKFQYNTGLVYLNQSYVDPKYIDEAVRYFVRSLALDTRYYLAWNGIGLAQSLKGNLAEAAKAFEKCLEIDPTFTEAHNNLGTIYQEMNKLDAAEKEFKVALLDQTYISRHLPYYNLARLYVLQNRLDEAFQNVQSSLKLQPRQAMAYNLKGLILEKQNKLDDAVLAYEQAVKVSPDDVLSNYNLGVAYFKTEAMAKAKEAFLRISEKATDAEMKDNIAKYLKIINSKRPGG